MKISYDPKYDLLYIKFSEGFHQVETKRLSDDIAIDFDEAGKIAGIEILSASKYLDLASLLPIGFDVP